MYRAHLNWRRLTRDTTPLSTAPNFSSWALHVAIYRGGISGVPPGPFSFSWALFGRRSCGRGGRCAFREFRIPTDPPHRSLIYAPTGPPVPSVSRPRWSGRSMRIPIARPHRIYATDATKFLLASKCPTPLGFPVSTAGAPGVRLFCREAAKTPLCM